MWYNYAKLVFGSLSGWSFAHDIDILICITNRSPQFSEYVIEPGWMVICIEPTFFLRVYDIKPLHGNRVQNRSRPIVYTSYIYWISIRR